MRITTKKGDKGFTSLMNGERVPKDSNIISLFSSIDKLISFLGICEDKGISQALYVQELLYKVFSELSYGKDINPKFYKILEERINTLEKTLPELKHFVIPSGISSYLHYARALARECEIKAVSLKFENTMIFFNRLSDYLFLLAYKISVEEGDVKSFK